MFKHLVLTTLIILTTLSGCGFYDSGKEILVDKPIESSKRKHDLLDARERVEKSRREYENCLKRHSQDQSKCDSYKESYEDDVEDYSSLQMD